jgi:hypothetical protein
LKRLLSRREDVTLNNPFSLPRMGGSVPHHHSERASSLAPRS